MPTLHVRSSLRSFRVREPRLARYFADLAQALRLGPRAAASVTFLGPKRIAALKEEHFGVKLETDCIAFGVDLGEMPGGLRYLGDMFFCPQVIRQNAVELGRDFETEALFVFAHGVLHLLGWDDETPRKRTRMWKKQEELLAACRPRGPVFAWSHGGTTESPPGDSARGTR